ncbi:MAG: antibiotic biosynthesis monooxygenase [Acidobacteriia bacterium]|nr:antibiotic biosynthesis monooxygenase [Terriglobia bacterium]
MIQIVWEFHVREEQRSDFERHYADGGTWAEFFQRDAAYKGTQLLHDITDPGRYVTIDTWDDVDSYGAFRAVNRQEYSALDQQMEALTESEKRLGVFLQL